LVLSQSKKLTPQLIKKTGKGNSWDPIVTQLILEHLLHCTPPSCIGPNILSAVKLLMPNATIMIECPSLRFIQYCRSILRVNEPQLFFDEEFMMENLFKTIVDKVEPLCEYLMHMFEEKTAFDVDGHATNDILLDLLCAALLYPARADIIQTNDFCLELAVVAI
jgi:hypothetical protein